MERAANQAQQASPATAAKADSRIRRRSIAVYYSLSVLVIPTARPFLPVAIDNHSSREESFPHISARFQF
jgi:hypothetical protein